MRRDIERSAGENPLPPEESMPVSLVEMMEEKPKGRQASFAKLHRSFQWLMEEGLVRSDDGSMREKSACAYDMERMVSRAEHFGDRRGFPDW